MTVGEIRKLLARYDEKYLIQLEFDSRNLNIRSEDYVGEFNPKTVIGTIDLPTEYEYRVKGKQNETKIST